MKSRFITATLLLWAGLTAAQGTAAFHTSFLALQVSMAPDSLPYAQLTAGGTHTCALTRSGTAFCWGGNRWGQLGDGRSEPSPGVPMFGIEGYDTTAALRSRRAVHVGGSHRFAVLSAGDRHSCGVTTDRAVYCWGLGRFGQLGHGATTNSAVPVSAATSERFRSVSAGGSHTCAITEEHALYCWGGNWHGQLGDGTLTSRVVPTRVASPLRFTRVVAAGIHTCAIDTTGAVWCWGFSGDARLGVKGPPVDTPSPTRVQLPGQFTQLAGWVHMCGLSTSGLVYCWGPNERGRFAPEHSDGILPPQVVRVQETARAVAVGPFHTCILSTRANVLCAGAHGFPGSDLETFTIVAQRIESLTAGGNDFSGHTCLLDDAARARCWGSDGWLQLGIWGPDPR